MPTLIAPAIGLAGAGIGAFQGKGAAKKQEKALLANQQEQQRQYKEISGKLFPMVDQAGAQGQRFLQGAEQGIGDLQKFWTPLVKGDRSAIDQFLAPERRAINEGYQATNSTLSRMAPRGGGRVSALAGANVKRQGAMNDLVFGSRREGANQLRGLAELLGGLGGQQQGQAMGALTGLAGGAANRQQGATGAVADMYGQRSGGMGQLGSSLGSFITDLFQPGKKSGSGGMTPMPIIGQGDTGAGNSF